MKRYRLGRGNIGKLASVFDLSRQELGYLEDQVDEGAEVIVRQDGSLGLETCKVETKEFALAFDDGAMIEPQEFEDEANAMGSELESVEGADDEDIAEAAKEPEWASRRAFCFRLVGQGLLQDEDESAGEEPERDESSESDQVAQLDLPEDEELPSEESAEWDEVADLELSYDEELGSEQVSEFEQE